VTDWPAVVPVLSALLAFSLACGGGAGTAGGGHRADAVHRAPSGGVLDTSNGTTVRNVQRAPQMMLDASAVQERVVTQWDSRSLFPHQTWPGVEGRRRGIVMSSGQQPWGGSVIWSGGLDVSEQRTEYRYYAEGSSAYAVYWASPDGRGANPIGWMVRDGGGGDRQMRSAMFHYDTPNEWGLHRRAHLVEVDALALTNGSNGGLHFVIESARVLDGTADFRLVVEDALMQLRQRFDDALRAAGVRIDSILQEGRRTVPPGYEHRTGQPPVVVVFPTWRDEERQMVAIFYARYQEAHLGEEQQRMTQCPTCPCTPDGRCAPCARCVPRSETFRPQINAGWEMAVRYIVSYDGRVLDEEILAAKAR